MDAILFETLRGHVEVILVWFSVSGCLSSGDSHLASIMPLFLFCVWVAGISAYWHCVFVCISLSGVFLYPVSYQQVQQWENTN